MGFLHKTIKDALHKAKHGDLEGARAIINEHRKKFMQDPDLEEGDELENLFYIIRDWKVLLATKEEWEDLSSEKTIEYLDKLEERVISFKRIIKRVLEEEEIILE